MGKSMWFVARTHVRREWWAAENVVRQGAEFYLPRMAEVVKVKGRTELRAKLLFPSYIFVLTDGRWRFLLSTFGMVGVVLIGQSPATLPDSVIKKLRKRENSDGLIVLPQRPESKPAFTHGQQVRVHDGLYSGLKGIYQDSKATERQHVLLDYFNQKTKVLIGDELLEAV